MEAWHNLMADEAMRWLFEGGIGAVFALLAYVVNEYGAKGFIPTDARKYLPLIAGALGVPIAAVLASWIPGVVAKELILAMGLGGVGSHVVHAGANAARRPPTIPPWEDGGENNGGNDA